MGFLLRLMSWIIMLTTFFGLGGCSLHGSSKIALIDGMVVLTPSYNVDLLVEVLGYNLPKMIDFEWPAKKAAANSEARIYLTNEQVVALFNIKYKNFIVEESSLAPEIVTGKLSVLSNNPTVAEALKYMEEVPKEKTPRLGYSATG